MLPKTQSFHEMWNGGDASHGWCSTPLVQMSSVVLGVKPAEPGFRKIAIRPTLCDLDRASGTVPTPHGDVAVAWTMEKDRLQLAVTVPEGTEADVTVPTSQFDAASLSKGSLAIPLSPGGEPTVHVAAGRHEFVLTGVRRPRPARPKPAAGTEPGGDACDAFEKDVVKSDLIHPDSGCCLARIEEHCSHRGGGGERPEALLNGTTRNGEGSDATIDDGRTFRGYADGDRLTFHLDVAKSPAGYDITEIRTFAGHGDSRASQNYTVLVAFAADPAKFVTLATVSVHADGGATKQCLTAKDGGVLQGPGGCRAAGVAAVRFEFRSGSEKAGLGLGFNVYREINVLGRPAGR